MILVDQKLISKLGELKTEYATQALSHPVEKTDFEYGRHCGVVEGIARVEKLITQLIEGEDKDGIKRRDQTSRAY